MTYQNVQAYNLQVTATHRLLAGTHPLAGQQVNRQQLRRHAHRLARHRHGHGALQLQLRQRGVGAVRLRQFPPGSLGYRDLRLAGGVRRLGLRQDGPAPARGGAGCEALDVSPPGQSDHPPAVRSLC